MGFEAGSKTQLFEDSCWPVVRYNTFANVTENFTTLGFALCTLIMLAISPVITVEQVYRPDHLAEILFKVRSQSALAVNALSSSIRQVAKYSMLESCCSA